MSTLLTASNLDFTENALKSYLLTNYLSGVTSIVVINSQGFAADDYILLGNISSETTEIVQVDTVTSATHTLSLKAATKFAHAESTRATIIGYNQVRFYHTATATFSGIPANLLTTMNAQVDSFQTQYSDIANSTGFGWYTLYNSTTTAESDPSAAIPYAGYDENAAKTILDSFYSLLNSKELKLISEQDALSWLNEGYAIALNHLNIVNKNYSATTPYSISVVSGTAEYSLPSNFSRVISLFSSTEGREISSIDIEEVSDYNAETANTMRYYIRGSYIGFTPEPTSSMTLLLRHTAKSTKITSIYSNLDLPNNMFYCLQDYMLFRASIKISRLDGNSHLKLFYKGIEEMKINSIKLDNELDAWEIANEANN
jgi:hypothetical protein